MGIEDNLSAAGVPYPLAAEIFRSTQSGATTSPERLTNLGLAVPAATELSRQINARSPTVHLLTSLGIPPAVGNVVRTIINGAATPRLPSAATVYALGDSRTLDNFRSGAITAEGPMTWARQLAFGRIQFLKAQNNGVGGATSADIRANQYPAAKASAQKILILLSGVNDANTGALTPTDTIANNTFMASDWCSSDPGRVCVILDEVPVTGLNKPSHQIATRDGIRLLHSPANGIYVCPSWDAIATVASGDTPQSWAYRDGIHWAKRGAWAVGNVIWNTLASLVPAFDIFAQPNVLFGGNFAGTGAALPTGWTVPTIPSGATVRMEAINGVNWRFFTIAAVTGLDLTFYPTNGATPAGFTPGATNVDTLMRYRVAANSQNLRFVSLEARRQGGTQLAAVTGEQGTDGVDGSLAGAGNFPPDAVDGLLRPPPLAFPSDSTSLRTHWARIVGVAGQPTSGEVGFAMPQARAA